MSLFNYETHAELAIKQKYSSRLYYIILFLIQSSLIETTIEHWLSKLYQ